MAALRNAAHWKRSPRILGRPSARRLPPHYIANASSESQRSDLNDMEVASTRANTARRISSGAVAHAWITRFKSVSNEDTQGYFVPLGCSANAARGDSSCLQAFANEEVAPVSVAGSNP